jgi:hypothetical protein
VKGGLDLGHLLTPAVAVADGDVPPIDPGSGGVQVR